MTQETGWTKWAKNGRLSTIVWGLTFVAWLTLKYQEIPLEGLDTVFVVMTGAWVTNLGLTTLKKPSENNEGKKEDGANASN